MDAMEERVSLPKNVRPERYTLTLEPNLGRFTFRGREEVEVEILEPTSAIMLNAVDLTIYRVQLEHSAFSRVFVPQSTDVDKEQETVMFHFAETLPVGRAKLTVVYHGELNDQMHGFYRSKYAVDGEERYMAVTQFEATDARRAFPCWDEPSIKATFRVTLEIPQDRAALSNMPVASTSLTKDGLKIVRFKETPVMSTYLLAFIVGEFDSIVGRTKNNTLVRVFTPVGKKEQGRFALDVAKKTLSFYDNYFGIPYPLPKLDLVAIPDFAAGAMENWGLVTYREAMILYDKEHSSLQTKQRIAIVIAHELAHQWFGNLVTMEWWTHLWLNEGFASWIEYLAADHLFPEWNIWTQFVALDFTRALDLDSLENSHPIEVNVKNPNEISEIFDAVSYSKGASLIRMLAEYVGDTVFRKGLKLYLTRHQYGNATTEDLWRALEEVSKKPIKAIMDPWTKQTGYPLVSFYKFRALDHRENAFVAMQSRFLARMGQIQEKDGPEWKIPLGILSKNESRPAFVLLEGKSKNMDFSPGVWMANPGRSGFYRVNYPPELWQGFIPAIRAGELSPRDRLGIQNDAFALARSGRLLTTRFLELAEAYEHETDYSVWMDLAKNFAQLDALLAAEPYYQEFQSFVCKLFRPITDRLGWDSSFESRHLDALLQALVLKVSGTFGNALVAKEAFKRFFSWAYGKNVVHLPAHLRFAVYSIVMGQAASERSAEMYDHLLRIFREADLHEEKVRCLSAFGYAREATLLNRTLEFALSEEVRAQDIFIVIEGVAANYQHGRELAWQFVRENWERICQRCGGNKHSLPRLISSTTSNFVTVEKAVEIEEFFARNLVPAAARTIRQSIESIHSNAEWLERDGRIIEKWLRDRIN